jgi:hypothetical protein
MGIIVLYFVRYYNTLSYSALIFRLFLMGIVLYSNLEFPDFRLQIKKRRPDTRLTLQYDKLYVNNAAYIYNEDKGHAP